MFPGSACYYLQSYSFVTFRLVIGKIWDGMGYSVCNPIPFGWDDMSPLMVPYRYRPMEPLGWDIPYLSGH